MFKVKRLLAIVLSMLMLVQALPMAALADEWSADTSFVLLGAKDTYTIRFVDENDATLLNQNQLIEAGESAVEPFVPDKEGYEFTGWESNVPGSTVEHPTGDTIFKATYRKLMEYRVQVDYVFSSDTTVKAQPSAVYEISEEDAKNGLTVVSPELAGFKPDQASVSFTEAEIKGDDQHKIVVYTGVPTTYTVKHMLQNADGNGYTEDTAAVQTINSEVGRTTTAEAKTYTGFTAQKVEQKTVAANGATVVEVKYDRNFYAVTYDSQNGTPVDGGLYRYGDTISSLPGASTMKKTGCTFSHWTLDGNQVTSVTMPAKDITLVANWTNNQTAPYTVRYWVMNLDDTSKYDFVKEVTGNTGDVGEIPTATFQMNISTLFAGIYGAYNKNDINSVRCNPDFFEINGNSEIGTNGKVKSTAEKIKADGSTVYDVYIDRKLVRFDFYRDGDCVYQLGGRYGQTFAQAHTKWPATNDLYIWYGFAGIDDIGWTYLDGFFNSTMTAQVVGFKESSAPKTKYVYHLTETLASAQERVKKNDASVSKWEVADTQYGMTGGGGYKTTEKFQPGYSVYGYNKDNTTPENTTTVYTTNWPSYDGTPKYFTGSTYTRLKIYNQRNQFEVSFTNCGTNPASMKYLFEEPLSAKKLPVPTVPPANVDSDYIFDGWYRDASFVNKVSDANGNAVSGVKMPAANMLLFAKWKAPEYTVTFYRNESASDESVHASVTVPKYDSIKDEMPANPTRTGYTFGGWYVNRECTIGFLDNTTVTHDIDVYAKWIPAGDPVYTVKYQDEQGNTLRPDEIRTPQKPVGSTITENAIHIAGYVAQKNSISFVLNYGSEIIFVYSRLEPWTLTVNYLEKGTNKVLVEQKTAVVTERSIVEVYVPVKDYNVEHGTEIQTATNESPIINFYYEPIVPGSVTVEYYYEQEDGSYEKETVTLDPQPVGDTVKVEPQNETTRDGQDYLLDEDNDENKFTDIVTKEGTTLKVYYELPIRDVSLTVDDETVTYNGKTQISDKPVQGSLLKDGHKWVYTYTPASGKNVGTTEGAFDGAGSFTDVTIVDENGKDVSEQYNITTKPGKLTIKPAEVIVTADSAEKEYGEADPELTATVSGLKNGDTASVIDYDLSRTPGEDVGKYPITPSGEEVQGNYIVKYVPGELRITKVTKEITITAASDRKTYDGTPLTNDGYTFTQDILVEGDVLTAVVEGTITNVGTAANKVVSYKVMRGNKDVTDYYTFGTPINGELVITPRPLDITADSAGKIYDGTPLTKNSYTISAETPLAKFDSIKSINVNGSQTDAGSSDNVASGAVIKNAKGEDVTANYAITYVPGKLTVTKQPVTITADSASKVYDGTALTKNSYTVDGLKPGDRIASVKVTGSQTDAGSSANVASNAVIVDAAGNDVTINYDISYKRGTLTVSKKPLVITAGSAEKEYDGTPLTENSYTAGATAAGDVIESVDVNGSQTLVGSSDNVASNAVIKDGGKDVTKNYAITYVPGELKVTKVAKEIIITAASDEKSYDGTPLTNDGYTFTPDILVEGDVLTAVVEGTITNVGTAANKVVSYKVMRGNKDVTDYYTFGTPIDGELVITPRPVTVTITGKTDTKYYNGEEQKVTGYDVEIKDDLYTEDDFSFNGDDTAKGTNVGKYPMGLKEEQFKNNDKNFAVNFEVVDGGLEIITQNLTITADSAEKVYDGTALTKNSYTVAGLKQGDKIASVKVTGSQTDAGSSANVASNAVIVDAAGNDVTANYNISYVPGTLNVSKKPLVITAGSAEKEYDGTPLTEDSYTVGDLAAGDVVESVDVNGSQTLVGSSDNVASNAVIKDGGKDVTKNYAITYVPGTLTVTGDPVIADKTTPAVESNYKLGETVPFQITVKNIMDKELKNVTVEDESAIIVAGTGYVVEGGVAKIASIPVGGSAVVNAQHVVTEEDILAGTYENTAKVTAENKVLYASCEVEVEDPAPHLTLTKITTNNINKDVVFDLGDVIEYEIKVVNDGNLTVTDIVVTDEMTGDVWTVEALKPGESASFNAEYVVTEGDLFRDTVVNVATATGKSEDPKNPEVPTEPGRTEDEIADPNPGFTVVKAITDTPENGLDYYELGETVDFSVTVTNYGNVTLNNVTIGEVLADAKFVGEAEGVTISEDGATAVIASIDPARKGNNVVVLAAQYTIKETDLGNEDLENMLTGKATYDNPEDPDDPEIPVDPDPIDPVPIPVDAVTSVNVTKVWDDQDNAFNTRSESIEVTLYQNVAGEKIAYKTATLTADAWSCSFEMLPAHKNGELIDYTVEEAEMVDENGVVIYTASYDKVETETGADWTITNTLQKYTLTIRYWFEEIGGEEAAKTFVREYYYGEAYNVTSPRITGYSVDKKTVSGVITKDAEYDVIYTPVDYRLTVYYVYEDGTTAARTHRETLRYKDKYGVDSPEISGYVASIKRVAGTMPGRDLKYTVIYVPETVIIEEYGVPLNLGNVVMNVGDCFE